MGEKINIGFVKEYRTKYEELDKNKASSRKEEIINKKIKDIFADTHPAYITRDIIWSIVDWKAPRVRGHVGNNEEEFVKDVTSISFSSKNERIKIEVLTLLNGVGYRTASAILHFAFPDNYIVMDWRAWESLQHYKEIEKDYGIKDDFEHWQRYLETCKSIVNRLNKTRDSKIRFRDLDKALWAYSKMNK